MELGYGVVIKLQLKFCPILFVFFLKFANYISRLAKCNQDIQIYQLPYVSRCYSNMLHLKG